MKYKENIREALKRNKRNEMFSADNKTVSKHKNKTSFHRHLLSLPLRKAWIPQRKMRLSKYHTPSSNFPVCY